MGLRMLDKHSLLREKTSENCATIRIEAIPTLRSE